MSWALCYSFQAPPYPFLWGMAFVHHVRPIHCQWIVIAVVIVVIIVVIMVMVIMVILCSGGSDGDDIGDMVACLVIWNSDAEMPAWGTIWEYDMPNPASLPWLSGYCCCITNDLLVLGSTLQRWVSVCKYYQVDGLLKGKWCWSWWSCVSEVGLGNGRTWLQLMCCALILGLCL